MSYACRVESVEELREKLRQLDGELNDPVAFRELYAFAFEYGKPASQRSMDVETAIAYWKILFKDKVRLFEFQICISTYK